MSKASGRPTIEVQSRDKALYKDFMTGKTNEIEANGKTFTAPPIKSLFPWVKPKKRSTEKVRDSSKNNKIGETIYDYDKSVFYDTRDLPIVRHPYGSGRVRCVPLNSSNCEPERIVFKAHGPQTGMCVSSDR